MIGRSWFLCHVAAAILGVCIVAARGEPPAGSDGSLAPFYRSLKVPGTGFSCCSEADCRTVVTTHDRGRLFAFIGQGFRDPPNNWVEVPNDAVIHGKANEVGEPIACYYGGRLVCFLDSGAV